MSGTVTVARRLATRLRAVLPDQATWATMRRSPRKDLLAWLHGHNEAFRRLGGVPGVLRIDNEKTAIASGAGPWSTVHPVYASYAKTLRFHVDAARPYAPRDKGKVERRIGDGRLWLLPPARLGLADERGLEVVVADARRAIRRLADAGAAPFDLVFFDPPYAAPDRDAILERLFASSLVGPTTRVVVEGSKRHALPAIAGARAVDERHYGDTVVTWLVRAPRDGGR